MYHKISKLDVIIIVVIALIIGIAFIFATKEAKEEEGKIVIEFSEVKEYNTYFMVVNKIDNFLSQLAENDNVVTYSMLDTKYIGDYNIDVNELNNYLPNYGTDVSVKVDNMEYAEIENNFIYYVEGKVEQTHYEELTSVVDDNFKIIMFLDINNMAYSFYPLNNEDYKEVTKDIKNISINSNKYNKYDGAGNISSNMICSMYLTDFIYKISNNTEAAYDLMTDTTKFEKFKTLDEYKSYMNANLDKFGTVAKECAAGGASNRVYAVYDENGNYYEFIENKIMHYKVKFKLNGEE